MRLARLGFALGIGFLVLLARPAIAGPDAESDAVEGLVRPGPGGERADPTDEALDELLSRFGLDPWLVAEHLLARDRQDLAVRLAKRADEKRIGPLRAYVEPKDAGQGSAERAVALEAACTALAAGKTDLALREVERIRAVPGRRSVLAARATAVKAEALTRSGRRVDGIDAWLAAGRDALAIHWWGGAGPYFDQARDAALAVRSLDHLKRSVEGTRALLEVSGNADPMGAAEENLGSIAMARGDLPGAQRHLDEAVALYDRLGKPDDAAGARSQRSLVLAELGKFREAVDEQHALAAYYAERPHDAAWAESEVRAGLVRHQLGDGPGAAAAFARSLEAFRTLEDREGEAQARGNIGRTHAADEEWDEAITEFGAALAVFEAVGDPIGVVTAKVDLADVLQRSAASELIAAELATDPAERVRTRAKAEKALKNAHAGLDAALPVAQKAGAAGAVCVARQTLGQVLLTEGRSAEAVEELEWARREAARLVNWKCEVESTVSLARAHVALKEWRKALEASKAAVDMLAEAIGGLPDADLARAQSLTPDVYDIGVRAAVQERDWESVAFFLETGRAAALLRGLGGRAAALRATVPEALETRLAAASRAKFEAFSAWQTSRDADLAVVKKLLRAYEQRRDEELEVRKDVEAAQDAAARRLSPASPVSTSVVQSSLHVGDGGGPPQIFVSFNFQDTEGVALRIDEEHVSAVRYRKDDLATLRTAFELLSASRDGELDATALADVKRLLLDPLKIPAGPVRLFVCPDRDLAYVPLAAIVPDEWELAWEPSATTYELLCENGARRGMAVLGLGDPDYRTVADAGAPPSPGGPRLTPLPSTRAEIAAVAGGPDDRRLLGIDATERGLRRALEAAGPKVRWKSVHLACHGVVNVEHPPFSYLAITPGDGEDGFLMSSEVLRLPLRTDLTVLSACQTGRGRFARCEGVMSLARSFMFAGSARVIASLWDVDDEATAFLMTEFYREWNGGRDTAKALRLAQLAVRDHQVKRSVESPGKPAVTKIDTPWKDPKYWAAWVLWGLAD